MVEYPVHDRPGPERSCLLPTGDAARRLVEPAGRRGAALHGILVAADPVDVRGHPTADPRGAHPRAEVAERTTDHATAFAEETIAAAFPLQYAEHGKRLDG